MIIEDVLRQKKEKSVWTCGVCQHDLHSDPSIFCESCLGWFHFRCVGLSKHPKKKIVFVDNAISDFRLFFKIVYL